MKGFQNWRLNQEIQDFSQELIQKKIYTLYYARSQTEYYSPFSPKKFMIMIACKYWMSNGIRNAQENSWLVRIIIRFNAKWLNEIKQTL